MKKESKALFIKGISDDIEHAIRQNGEYSHNIVSIRLRLLADKYGMEEANKMIKKHKLTEIYAIQPVDVPKKKRSLH